jgi:hypothetical protein
VDETMSPEAMAVVKRVLSKPNPFDYWCVDHDPGAAWLYVYKEMKGITPVQRHALLRFIIAVRRHQGGRIDEERTANMLDEVLRNEATP